MKGTRGSLPSDCVTDATALTGSQAGTLGLLVTMLMMEGEILSFVVAVTVRLRYLTIPLVDTLFLKPPVNFHLSQ